MSSVARPIGLCFWPGLAQLWLRGTPAACGESLIFALLLNTLLVATFVWPEWFAGWQVQVGWLVLATFWFIESVQSYRKLPQWLEQPRIPVETDLLPSAQVEYLKGNWFEAEAILLQQLASHKRDAESMLLLAGVLRHTGRLRQARESLEELGRWESGARWQLEIAQENELIRRKLEQLQEDKPEPVESN